MVDGGGRGHPPGGKRRRKRPAKGHEHRAPAGDVRPGGCPVPAAHERHLWLDERARELLPDLERSFASIDFHALTGKRLSVNLTIAKIAWLKEYRPECFARTAKYLDVHSFLVRQLTGFCRTGWGCADPTGLFDIRNNVWAADLLNRMDIRADQLPELCAPGTIVGEVTPSAAEACGLPAGLPVAAGIGDGQACGLGVDINSRAMRIYRSARPSSPELSVSRMCSIRRFGR